MEFITTGNRIAVENFSIGKVYTIVWATGNYKSLACVGKGSDFVMFQDQAPDLLFCLTMDTAIAVESIDEGGGAGTMNYNELENKPSINGIVLVGNKTGADLNLVSQADLDDYATNASLVAGLATKQDALSSSQLAAVNSGITSALVTQIGTNTSAIAGKQDALSSSQLAAVNSGITSADVAQITTNKTNISTVYNANGRKNILSNKGSLSKDNMTYTWTADGTIQISGTKTAGTGNYVEPLSLTTFSKLGLSTGDTIVLSSNGTNSYISVIFWSSSSSYSSSYDITNGSREVLIPNSYTHMLIRVGVKPAETTASETISAMICDKKLWDISPEFAPYAPTNAELYAMIQALQS